MKEKPFYDEPNNTCNKLLTSNLELEDAALLMNPQNEDKLCIKKITVNLTEDAVSVAHRNHRIYEKLLKINNKKFEGFNFSDENETDWIILERENEKYEIEITGGFYKDDKHEIEIKSLKIELPNTPDLHEDSKFIGHRGSGPSRILEGYIENTEHAFDGAINKGAKWVELDVQLTKDGIPIIFHDFSIKKGNEAIPIINLTFLELNEIYNLSHNKNKEEKLKILKLNEVLEKFTSLGINIEIKYPLLHETKELFNYEYLSPYDYVLQVLKTLT